MAAGKDWIDILQALLTPTVAGFGLYIAIQQWRINKNRLKHELYDRRMAVYAKLLNYLGILFQSADFNHDAFTEWLRSSYEGYFLFNDDINNYFQTISEKSRALMKVKHKMSRTENRKNDEAWAKLSNEDVEIEGWFDKQFEVAKDKFSPFLRLDF
jgi:hypothetical protein